jgi:hypothetical protein
VQAVLAHHARDALGRAAVDGEHPAQPTVLEVGLLDPDTLLPHGGARGDDVCPDRPPGVGDRVEGAVDARLDVLLAGRRDEEVDVPFAHELPDARAELEARLVEVLADVGQP